MHISIGVILLHFWNAELTLLKITFFACLIMYLFLLELRWKVWYLYWNHWITFLNDFKAHLYTKADIIVIQTK